MRTNSARKQEPLTVADELRLIMKINNGLLDPVKVVGYARSPDTALHAKFEWDNSEAAERYRIWQARMVIRLELTVVLSEESSEGGKETRAFVSLVADRHSDTERGYRSMVEVLSDSDLREQLLDEARRDMRIFRRKYDQLKELSKVFAAMEELV